MALRTLVLLSALGALGSAWAWAGSGARSFRVTADTPSLSEVGLYLYGKGGMYRDIARWNGLKAPYRIRLGQRLLLRKEPTLTEGEGRARLLGMWRKRFGLPDQVVEERRAEERGPTPIVASHEQVLLEGNRRLQARDFSGALGFFRQSRTENPKYLPAWFLELRALKEMKDEAQISEVLKELLRAHPEVENAPVIERYRKGTAPP